MSNCIIMVKPLNDFHAHRFMDQSKIHQYLYLVRWIPVKNHLCKHLLNHYLYLLLLLTMHILAYMIPTMSSIPSSHSIIQKKIPTLRLYQVLMQAVWSVFLLQMLLSIELLYSRMNIHTCVKEYVHLWHFNQRKWTVGM